MGQQDPLARRSHGMSLLPAHTHDSVVPPNPQGIALFFPGEETEGSKRSPPVSSQHKPAVFTLQPTGGESQEILSDSSFPCFLHVWEQVGAPAPNFLPFVGSWYDLNVWRTPPLPHTPPLTPEFIYEACIVLGTMGIGTVSSVPWKKNAFA